MLHIYYGDGKGKTTSAFGLALRALSNNLTVYMAQFMKDGSAREVQTLQSCFSHTFTHEAHWDTSFILNTPHAYQQKMFDGLFYKACSAVNTRNYDMYILDELLSAHMTGLISEQQLLLFVDSIPSSCELILTGYMAPLTLIKKADLVSHIVCDKHYYNNGVAARRGIEY